MAEKSVWEWISLVLVIIGGINWGLIGLFNLNLVNAALGSVPVLEKIVNILIGIGAVYTIFYVSKK